MTVPQHNTEDDWEERETPEDVVARIRARGKEQTLPPPPTSEAIERLAAHVARQTPLTPLQQAEWDRAWNGVFAEMRRLDEADETAEGRFP